MSALENAQRAEAEALDVLWEACGKYTVRDTPLGDWIRAYAEAVRHTERLRAEELFAAFNELLDGAEDMRPYVSDYFAEKWGHDEYLSNARAAIAAYRESIPGA